MEDGSEEGSEGGADHCLPIDAVSQTESRRDIVLRCVDVERWARVESCDQHLAGRGIEAAIDVVRDRQRGLILPAQADVQGQLRRHLVVVLGEDAEIPIATTGGGHRLLVASGFDLAEQEVSKTSCSVAGVAMVGNGAVECQRTLWARRGVIGVELILAQRPAEFEGVRSPGFGDTTEGSVSVGDVDLVSVGVGANTAGRRSPTGSGTPR